MNPRILVVDDDTAISEMIGIVLRAEGFEPSFAADGAAALEAFAATDPDLVLLDLMLPGIDGIEGARASVPKAAFRSSCSPQKARRRMS